MLNTIDHVKYNANGGVHLRLLLVLFCSFASALLAQDNVGILPENTPSSQYAGVMFLRETPKETRNLYYGLLLTQLDYKACEDHKRCPISSLFLSLLGEGDAPEMVSYNLGSGLSWRFEKWIKLPTMPLTDTSEFLEFEVSRLKLNDYNGPLEHLTIHANFKEFRTLVPNDAVGLDSQ